MIGRIAFLQRLLGVHPHMERDDALKLADARGVLDVIINVEPDVPPHLSDDEIRGYRQAWEDARRELGLVG